MSASKLSTAKQQKNQDNGGVLVYNAPAAHGHAAGNVNENVRQ